MATNPEISRQLDLQRRVFRIATDPMRYGLPVKVIAADSGIPESTLRTYADGSSAMSLHAFVKLIGVLPDDLLSLLLPETRQLVPVAKGSDHDALAANCLDYAARYAAARHPNSPGGVDIDLVEAADLDATATKLGVVR